METTIAKVDKNNYKIDLGRALEYRLKNRMSYASIGKLFGVSAQAIHKRLKRFSTVLDDPDIISAHEATNDKILTGTMHKLIGAAVEPARVKSASTLQLVTSYGICFDKQRLLRGQATSITGNVDLTADEREQLKILEARIIDSDNCTVNSTPQISDNDINELQVDSTVQG